MKDSTGNLLLSIPAVLFSIIALAMAYPRSQELDFDYYGIVLTILSILVTLLIGWNIIQAVKLDKKMGEVKLTRKKAEDYLQKTETINKDNRLILELNIAFTQAELFRYARRYLSAFKNYIQVLYCYEVLSKDSNDIDFKIRENAIYGINLILKQFDNDKTSGDRPIPDIDLEYDIDFLKYRKQLQNHSEYSDCFKRIDNYFLKFLSKTFGGGVFRIYRNDVFINQRPNSIFLLLNINASPSVLSFNSEAINKEIQADIVERYKYIAIHPFINTTERDDIIGKIKQTYKDIRVI